MADLLLVHGAFHGSWCWDVLVPSLERAGHTVSRVDLPGHGQTGMRAWGVRLDDYAKAVRAVARDIGRPVVAVGHDLGGAVTAHAASQEPALFSKLIHVAAYVPKHGERVAAIARGDKQSKANWTTWVGPTAVHPKPSTMGPLFYNKSPQAMADWALGLIGPTPLRPIFEPVWNRYTGPQAYIHTLEDTVLSPHTQRWMVNRLGIAQTHALAADHAPFFSAPEALADGITAMTRLRRKQAAR